MSSTAGDTTSQFMLNVNGQIDTAEMPGADGVFCKFEFVCTGYDWDIVDGPHFGTTQIAYKKEGADGSVLTWNMPLSASFTSTNPAGWPQLALTLYRYDLLGRLVLAGYGTTHVPLQSGSTTKYIHTYAPKSTSLLQQFTSMLTGTAPEYYDDSFITKGTGREVTRTYSTGKVKVTFHVATRDLAEAGYVTSSSSNSKGGLVSNSA